MLCPALDFSWCSTSSYSFSAATHHEILGFVKPWSAILPEITVPVTLWHGTADNWSPIAMAHHLKEKLPNARPVVRLDGHSHYSTLREALCRL